MIFIVLSLIIVIIIFIMNICCKVFRETSARKNVVTRSLSHLRAHHNMHRKYVDRAAGT